MLRPGLHQQGTRNLYYHGPDNTLLITHSRSSRVHLINLNTGVMRFHDFHSKTARKILVHQNEIITASWDATISVVDYATLRQRLKLTHNGMGRSPYVAVSGSGEHFVTFSYDSDIRPEYLTNSVKIWSAKTGELEKEINNTGEHQTTIRSGACLVHGKYLYVISDSGDLKKCKFKGKLTVYHDSFVVSPVDSNLFFTNDISNLEILDKETGKPMTGKQAEYLLNAFNCESVLQDVFKSEDELMEINKPSPQLMLQLPNN
jgi:WD40 repeat protein